MDLDSKAIIHKTRDDYNRIARHFSDTRYDNWPEIEQFLGYIKYGQNILDWGCGNGRLVHLLKDQQVKYFGVDQSDELLKYARLRFQKEITDGWVKFLSSAETEVEFSSEFFDLVFMVASFHHLPDEKTRLELLKKVFKEMKSGGRLIITVWNLGSDWVKNKEADGWKEFAPGDFMIPWKNTDGAIEAERYYHNFSQDELGDLLVRVGFKIEKLDYYGNGSWSDKKGGRNLVAVAVK